jgi:hypothetical protein
MAIPPKTSPDSSASAGRPCIGTWVTTPQRESWRPRWSAHVTAVVEVAWPTTSARPARPYTVPRSATPPPSPIELLPSSPAPAGRNYTASPSRAPSVDCRSAPERSDTCRAPPTSRKPCCDPQLVSSLPARQRGQVCYPVDLVSSFVTQEYRPPISRRGRPGAGEDGSPDW